ncbi:MAG: hypothetical protein B6D59_06450 [Campylobacteraceae bacterium 4484_4]|nr:MAG: hypothetical protein B6D59_06450 [Campylobacteraceae bacterium 4484_4]
MKNRMMRPKRTLLLLLLSFLPLLGLDFQEANATYHIRFGVVGEIGVASAHIELGKGTYKIRLEAQARGIAKLLSRNRKEVYESTGSYENGMLLPNLFVKRISRGNKREIKRYFFDHRGKSVRVVVSRIEGETKTDRSEPLAYYADNDILSLYFNLRTILDRRLEKKAGKITLYAVGANKKDGHLDLIVPDEKARKKLEKLVGSEGRILVAMLHQKIFSSRKGELVMRLNEKGICTKAVLKDVIFFGDIVGEIDRLSIK